MNEVGKFNINSLSKPANKNITVVFSPSENVVEYTYEIYKDGNIINTPVKMINKESNIVLSDSGKYGIRINAIFSDGSSKILDSGHYIIDKEKPKIIVRNQTLNIKNNQTNKIKENAIASDNLDGDISSKVTTNINSLNLNTDSTQKLVYSVKDSAGNIDTKEININISHDPVYLFVIQGIIAMVIIISIYFIKKINRNIKVEKRIKPFTVTPIKDKNMSILDVIISFYQKITKKMSKSFTKSVVAQKYSKKLEKYLPVTKIHKTSLDIFAGKIITAFIFVITALFLQALRFKTLEGYEYVIIFTFGFFVLDILYFIKYKMFRWKLESDFIAAITIMNNAFKSGRSITQAIDLVSKELKGTVGREFNRMSIELLYGLEIETVFKRFAKRIDLEEASYLTASLTILNKTGGDIIKVFDSIEKSMFNKRKLRLELASLTSGSKIVVGVLLGMPFLFVLVISIINPGYFMPFFNTNIGLILLIFMLIYYIIFVVVVRKIMKVVI